MTVSTRSAKNTTKQAAKKGAARPGPRVSMAEGESAVLAVIAAMLEPDRALGTRLHAIIKAGVPTLSPKLWYGMPAYAKDGKVVCFFQGAQRLTKNWKPRPVTGRATWMTIARRYATLGFSDAANLDEGGLWPVGFAVKKLTPAVEAKIVALVKKAVS